MNRGLFAENERSAWIFLNRFLDLGPIRFHRLLLEAKSAQGILELPISGLLKAEVSLELAETWHQAFRDPQNQRWLDAEIGHLERGDCGAVTELDGDYPQKLRELFDRPPVLYYKGRWPLADTAWVGLVGTRHPSSYGRSVTERLTADLCGLGVGTVSGLAQGIDTYVHETTLRSGGLTVAVLGCGLGQVFPKENARLQQRISEAGTVVSEFPYNSGPAAPQFPRRNRIISGLSQGIVVIEAGRRSGASITARFAAEQGREVFAVPGSIFESTSTGCHRLIKQGAKLIESAADVLEDLEIPSPLVGEAATLQASLADVWRGVDGGTKPLNCPPPQSRHTTGDSPVGLATSPTRGEEEQNLSPLEKQIAQLVSAAPLSADQISSQTSQRFEVIASSLLSLELKGIIRMFPGQRYGKN